jgi:hypothetical protein
VQTGAKAETIKYIKSRKVSNVVINNSAFLFLFSKQHVCQVPVSLFCRFHSHTDDESYEEFLSQAIATHFYFISKVVL